MEIETKPQPTLKRKQRKPNMKIETSHHLHLHLHHHHHHHEPCMVLKTSALNGDEEEEEVEKKIEALQRIVPGGESLGVDKLFEVTAGYIMALQVQLKAMKALVTFFEEIENEKKNMKKKRNKVGA